MILGGIFILFQYIFPNSSAVFIQDLVYGSFIISGIVAILYVIVIIPIFLMALVRMVQIGELNAAFEVREILDKIRSLGCKNFIKWYLVTIIPTIALIAGILVLGSRILNIIHLQQLIFLILFILAPIFVYISRSVALFYMSENLGYLICEKCEGYYELQPGESPEDYDQCQCGGKLKYSTSIAFNESDDLNFDKYDTIKDNNKLRSLINFRNNKFLIIVLLLSLSVIATPLFIYSTESSTQTSTNYTLLKSYNASILNQSSISVSIPNGTQKIKIDYNLSTKPDGNGNPVFTLNSYDTDINESISSSYENNIIDKVGLLLVNGQNKTGTYNFNNPQIKSLKIIGNGIQGTIKIYTSQ